MNYVIGESERFVFLFARNIDFYLAVNELIRFVNIFS